MAMSQLDSAQCIKTSFDDATGTLKVSQTGDFEIDFSAASGDSVLAVGTTDGTTSGTQKVLKTDSNGELQVDILSSALPSGAATEATLSAASGKLPATLGQKAMAASLAVVVASDQSAVPISAASLPLPSNASRTGYSFSNLAANATTTVKSGAGLLRSITINTKGASSNTITVYDNTAASGTKIATIDSTVTYGTLLYDLSFATGLTIIIATGTAPDITVSYI